MAEKSFTTLKAAQKFAKAHDNGTFGSTGILDKKVGKKTVYVVRYFPKMK